MIHQAAVPPKAEADPALTSEVIPKTNMRKGHFLSFLFPNV
jgi:hypothetical protein